MECYVTYTGDLVETRVAELIQKGCTGFRLIYKTTSFHSMVAKIEQLRRLLVGTDVRILVDLPGERPRLGRLHADLSVSDGDRLILAQQRDTSESLCLPLENLSSLDLARIHVGHRVWLSDGTVELVVDKVFEHGLACLCVGGRGALSSGRSVVFPDSGINNRPLSCKDEEFLRLCRDNTSIDEFAVSFVADVETLTRTRRLLDGSPHAVVAKIESLVPDEDLGAIISAADKVLLGRGDLSMCAPFGALFAFQNKVIVMCQDRGTPLIVGTGLFASLAYARRPTIAECMDVAYLIARGVSSFLIADDVSVLQPNRCLTALRDMSEAAR